MLKWIQWCEVEEEPVLVEAGSVEEGQPKKKEKKESRDRLLGVSRIGRADGLPGNFYSTIRPSWGPPS